MAQPPRRHPAGAQKAQSSFECWVSWICVVVCLFVLCVCVCSCSGLFFVSWCALRVSDVGITGSLFRGRGGVEGLGLRDAEISWS